MIEDEEGFRYPHVNTDLCTSCNLCDKICPINNPITINKIPQKAYIAQHIDSQILKESTSGGAFTGIASWIIEQGGIVYGATYNKDFEVVHSKVDKIEDLSKFRNSKYSQSVIGNCFNEVKEYLKQNRWVCFSGTPCQLEGLYSYLGRKEYDKLLMVDVVCHACPSPKVFRKYIEMQKTKIGINFENIIFRRKTYGYKYSTMSIITENPNKNYHEGIDTDVMMRAFFSNISVRPSCYACPFKKQYRCTDFTLWDCFDVFKFSKELNNDKGITRILAHTEKAKSILQLLSNKMIIKEIEVNKAIEGVKEMVSSVKENPKRKDFFYDLERLSPQECFNKYFPLTIRHKIEKRIRLLGVKLGIYMMLKSIFFKLYKNKDIKR